MLQDLAALAPPVIVCVAFLVGVGMLVRHELAPKRPGRAGAGRSEVTRSEAVPPEAMPPAAVPSAAVRSAAVRSAAVPPGAGRSLSGPGAPGEGRAEPREVETAPDRGDGSQT
jgi:hypothetical protein